MKLFSILLTLSLFINSSCKSDDDAPQHPVDVLPPATQTGAQTFGCLIDGKPYVPPRLTGAAPRAFYQFADGAYTLGISGGRIGGGESEIC